MSRSRKRTHTIVKYDHRTLDAAVNEFIADKDVVLDISRSSYQDDSGVNFSATVTYEERPVGRQLLVEG